MNQPPPGPPQGPPPGPGRYPPGPGQPSDPAAYPPPGGGYAGGPPPEQGYVTEPRQQPPPGYPKLAQPATGYVEPQFLPPGYPPRPEPRAPRRRTPVLAPALALVGLVVIAAASIVGINFLDAALGERAAAEASSEPGAVAALVPTAEPTDAGGATPQPTEEATPDPEEEGTLAPPEAISAPVGDSADIKGSIVFTRSGGDIWQASGRELRNLTSTKSTKSDLGPAWSPDGRYVYFIRRGQRETDKARLEGKYTLHPTDLMRMKPDGSDRKVIYESLTQSGGLWFTHVLQPSVSPNGTVAVVSDGPDGSGPVILHVVSSKNGRMRRVPVPVDGELGHNDPAFSPDGTRIAYTYNNAVGTDGAPRVGVFTCKTKANCGQGKNKLLKLGFANPSWSPDAKWLAVESTDGTGRDIAIIGARQGEVRVFLTDDGNSFAPVVSPDGDQIAYLKRDGTAIDLRVMTLDVDERGAPTLLADQAVTTDGLVDGESAPSWYIPRSQRTNRDVSIDPGDTPAETEEPADGSATSEGAPAPPG